MQRAVKLEALLLARTQCQTEYIAMVKTGNECQLEGYMLHGSLLPRSVAQTERFLTRPVFAPHLCGILLAVCIKPKEHCTCHPCIDCVTSCVVLPVLHAQLYDTSARVLRASKLTATAIARVASEIDHLLCDSVARGLLSRIRIGGSYWWFSGALPK